VALQQYEQPMMYQQPNSMNYQQQPAMMQHDPNKQQIHQQQQMYGQPPPHQYQGGPMGYEMPQRILSGGSTAQDNGSQFKTATPIPNLGMGASPVDCPSCGKRSMTRISYHVGNTTQ
jgi:lipopolysaccharide-induced tumor necrosis factor-alpha factor